MNHWIQLQDPFKGQGWPSLMTPSCTSDAWGPCGTIEMSFWNFNFTIGLHSLKLAFGLCFLINFGIKKYFIVFIYFIYMLIWWCFGLKILPCVSYICVNIWYKIFVEFFIAIYLVLEFLHSYMHRIIIIFFYEIFM